MVYQPKNYLDYISTYRQLLQVQRKSNEDMANRLSGGVLGARPGE
jgi:hypothetical protein